MNFLHLIRTEHIFVGKSRDKVPLANNSPQSYSTPQLLQPVMVLAECHEDTDMTSNIIKIKIYMLGTRNCSFNGICIHRHYTYFWSYKKCNELRQPDYAARIQFFNCCYKMYMILLALYTGHALLP
jgi:hypothetical protein